MRFGEFFTAVCEALRTQQHWAMTSERVPQMLITRPEVLNIIYDHYQMGMKEMLDDCAQTRGVFERADWPGHVGQAAYKLNEAWNNAAGAAVGEAIKP